MCQPWKQKLSDSIEQYIISVLFLIYLSDKTSEEDIPEPIKEVQP